jgi:signal transduction histidine kinase
MTLAPVYNYYKIGRFIFALALLVSFQITGLLHAVPGLSYIITIYSIIALLRLLIAWEAIGYFDFILDIVFISALVHVSFGIYSYLSLFYLFPIFFSSTVIRTRKIFLYPMVATCFYGAVFVLNGVFLEKESLLNILLHAFSFFVISFAGNSLNERLDKQDKYIKRLEEERIKMQGLERLYRVSADLAHELRNPLAAISAAVQFLKEGKKSQEFIGMLDTETNRLTNLVNDFLMFSRPSDAPKEEVDLSDMVRIIIARNRDGKAISADIEEDIIIFANRMLAEVALTNVFKNALDAAQTAVFVKLKRVHSDREGSLKNAVVEIEDDGSGIDDLIKERIFEPFFTTKQNGTGLGLAIANRVITSFSGQIIVDKSPHGGARMTITLPYENRKIIKRVDDICVH